MIVNELRGKGTAVPAGATRVGKSRLVALPTYLCEDLLPCN